MEHKLLKRLIFALFFSLLLVTSSFGQKKNKSPLSASKNTVIDTVKVDYSQIKAPVIPFADTLFYIYGNIGSVTPLARAEAIENNIRVLSKDPFFNADSLRITVEANNYMITYSGENIMGINDIQADVLQKDKNELSREYLEKIAQSVLNEKEAKSLQNILKLIGLGILILLATYFIIKYLNIGYRKLSRFIAGKKEWTIEKINFILDANKQIAVILFLLKTIRFFAVLFILYMCLYAFLSLFPETKWLSDTLIGYILSPLKEAFRATLDFIPELFTIIVIIVLFRFFIKFIKIVTERVGDGSIFVKGFYADWAEPTFHIIKVVLYAFMIILIFPHLPGSNSEAFKGVSVFLGILFSLGSTSVIANIVSGIVITYMRPFKIGDRIRMGDLLGNVIEKTPLVTRIKTPKNEIVTIPNGSIMSAQTINYTNSANEYGLILYATITVGYEVPWRQVHELLIEAGLNTPDVLQEPKPFILQLALDDFYVQYQINVYTKDANKMAAIYSDLNKNIQDIFNREEIELVSPQFMAQMQNVETKPPKDFVKTGFDRIAPFNMKTHIKEAE